MLKPLWRIAWRCIEKLGIKLPHDPAVPLLGLYPEKTVIQKDTCTSMFRFPGGSVVKNPPANAGDVGFIFGSG